MTIKYVCDRCGMDDDPFFRKVEITNVNTFPGAGVTLLEYDEQTLHMCGYCTGKFREWMKTRG